MIVRTTGNMTERTALAALEVFHGPATPLDCRVYVRAPSSAPTRDCKLQGKIVGPECQYAQTLSAAYPLAPSTAEQGWLATALVTEPCFWTPELPQLYRAVVELVRGSEVLGRTERVFGLRRLGGHGADFRWEGRRWVLRGVRQALSAAPLAEWRAAFAAAVVPWPDENVCSAASHAGTLIVADLRPDRRPAAELIDAAHRLAAWPAVGLAVLPAAEIDERALRASAPNLLLGCDLASSAPSLPAWAQFAWCTWTGRDAPPSPADCPLPLVVERPLSLAESVAAARQACDDLQRDLAPHGAYAGYVV